MLKIKRHGEHLYWGKNNRTVQEDELGRCKLDCKLFVLKKSFSKYLLNPDLEN